MHFHAYPAAGHDQGLHRGVHHCVKWGRKLQPPFPQKVQHGGPHVPPLEPQHGRGALQQRQSFPHGQWCHSQKPTTPPSGIVLTTKDNRWKPVLSITPLNPDRRHNEATLPTRGPLPQSSQKHHLSVSLRLRQGGS
jgi:hypothetical protein